VAERGGSRVYEHWAQLRFAVVGPLLASPPAKGALRATLEQLAAREWRHPSTGAPIRFGVSTLERWYYQSRNEPHDPVSVLRRKRRATPKRSQRIAPRHQVAAPQGTRQPIVRGKQPPQSKKRRAPVPSSEAHTLHK
jgi:hypothetical protein